MLKQISKLWIFRLKYKCKQMNYRRNINKAQRLLTNTLLRCFVVYHRLTIVHSLPSHRSSCLCFDACSNVMCCVTLMYYFRITLFTRRIIFEKDSKLNKALTTPVLIKCYLPAPLKVSTYIFELKQLSWSCLKMFRNIVSFYIW